jgi:hypothetical protein
MTFRAFLLALAVSLPAHSALADGEVQKLMTPADRARLDGYAETRLQAIEEAKRGGSPEEVAELEKMLGKRVQSFDGFDMTGTWQCRTTKIGAKSEGLLPLVIYGWFKCRVTDDGSGWKLEKISGSQRTTGRFYDDNPQRLIYLGSLHVNDEKPKPYGSGPETDQIGYAFRTGQKEWRIELAAPYYESKLDILEFRK